MTQIEKRPNDLTDAIKRKKTRDDKVRFIVVHRLDGWTETHNIETGEITREYNHEQNKQTT